MIIMRGSNNITPTIIMTMIILLLILLLCYSLYYSYDDNNHNNNNTTSIFLHSAKGGAVEAGCSVLYGAMYYLLHNTTPVHCTPLPLHPPLQSIQCLMLEW